MGKARKAEAKKASGREKITDNVKRAAIYVRVSTVEQETDLQEHELQEYCERVAGVVLSTGIKVIVTPRMTDQLWPP